MTNEEKANVEQSLQDMREILAGTYAYPDGTQPTPSEGMQLIAARAAIITATYEGLQPSLVMANWACALNEAEAEVVIDFMAQVARNN
jgi:hypothetical protein